MVAGKFEVCTLTKRHQKQFGMNRPLSLEEVQDHYARRTYGNNAAATEDQRERANLRSTLEAIDREAKEESGRLTNSNGGQAVVGEVRKARRASLKAERAEAAWTNDLAAQLDIRRGRLADGAVRQKRQSQ